MTGPTPEPTTPNQSPSLQDKILNHVSSLETLIKQHNEKSRTLITPIRLTFGEEVNTNIGNDKEKGGVGVDDNLKRPYKEVLESPFTRRIIKFLAPSHLMPTNLRVYDGFTDPNDHISRFVGAANQEEWEMPVWCRMFQQKLDGPTRGWFDRMPNGSINSWSNLREKFVKRIIQGVPKVMQISAFMSNSKCLELARRFVDQVPQTVTEMIKRVDDFVKSEEAFKSTELPKGKQSKKVHGVPYKWFQPPCAIKGGGPPRGEGYNAHNQKDHYPPYGAAVQVMFEHCFRNLCPAIQARLSRTHTELVGFSEEQLRSMGKIELEVVFRNEGLSRITIMKFTVVEASSPYNIILGRTGMRERHAVSSTTRAMMKFPTSRGIATLARKKQSSDEGSEGMAQSGDSKAGTVPHMDIKPSPSKKRKDVIMDVMETFDNLKKINMKLNLKNCSFGVKEGKFLGYMVTSEGIRANPKKTKVVADMQSSKMLKEMQSLSGKLAVLNRFLSRSAECAMPFFDTLKNTTKENKDEFHWTEAAEQAFQELKTVIMELPTLTTPNLKETLYVYLAASRGAVSEVPMADRMGKQTPIQGIRKSSQVCGRARSLQHRIYDVKRNQRPGVGRLFERGFGGNWKCRRAGLVLIDPTGTEYTYAIRFNFASTNNKAVYEALLAGLRIARKMKVPALKVKVDSKLVACQMNGEFVHAIKLTFQVV
nr:reverse transcriptase domain-containing protein [Tanacetum cinerariifolium]